MTRKCGLDCNLTQTLALTGRCHSRRLTAALYGEITLEKGRVQQSNFHDYRMLRIDQIPAIDIDVIRSDAPPGGIGEAGTIAALPALRNAIYAATGVALRRMMVLAGAPCPRETQRSGWPQGPSSSEH